MASRVSDVANSTASSAHSSRRLRRMALGLCLAVSLTVLGSTAAHAAPSSAPTPRWVECQQTTGSAFINSNTYSGYDIDGKGSHSVQLTIEAQKLIDIHDGAYCGMVRSHQKIKCDAASTCTSMHLEAWMRNTHWTYDAYGDERKYIASLAPLATDTIYSDWVSISDPCNWIAMGYYAHSGVAYPEEYAPVC
jgi:hypothetical protein